MKKVEARRPEVETGRQRLSKLEDLRPHILRLGKAEAALAAARRSVVEQADALDREKRR